MVICHCLAVNDLAISALAGNEIVSVDDIVAMCGAGGRCGGCRESIQLILDRAHQRADTGTRVQLASLA